MKPQEKVLRKKLSQFLVIYIIIRGNPPSCDNGFQLPQLSNCSRLLLPHQQILSQYFSPSYVSKLINTIICTPPWNFSGTSPVCHPYLFRLVLLEQARLTGVRPDCVIRKSCFDETYNIFSRRSMINQQIPFIGGAGSQQQVAKETRRERISPEKHKHPSMETTAVGGELWTEESEESDDQSLSDCRSEGSDVSFEEDILQDHKMAMEKEMSKNAWFFGQGGKIFKNLSMDSFLHEMLNHLRDSKCIAVHKFHQQRRKQPSLEKFLLFVYHSFPDKAVSKTLKLFYLIWELYLPYLSMHLEEEEIHSISLKIVNRIHSQQTSGSRYLHIHAVPFLQLLRTVTTTFVCVLEKLFHNSSLTAFPSQQVQQEGKEEIVEETKVGRKCRKLDTCPLLA